jgi:hypothetical protein
VPYSLTRHPSVDNDLAAIWMAASDRDGVAAASHQIDQLLRFAPDSVGEDCGDHRKLTIGPLIASYPFSPDDCMVNVIKIELANM